MLNRIPTLALVVAALLTSGNTIASDLQSGQTVYRQHCAMCHGNNGTPMMAGAPDFRRGEGMLKSDFTLLDRIKAGRNACPAYIGILKEQQIFDVIAYIRTFY